MGNNRKVASVILGLAAGILAIVAALLYKNVMYTYKPVYYMLIGAAVVGVLQFVVAGFAPRFAAYFPICTAALLASAAVWGTQLMVNQLGYVVAGLDGMNTIMTWIYFIAVTVVAMLVAIVAAFLRSSPELA